MLKYKNITTFMFVISFLLIQSFADAYTDHGWDPYLTKRSVQTWQPHTNAFRSFEDGETDNRSYLLVDVAEVLDVGEYYHDGINSHRGSGPGYKINEAGKPLSFSWGYDGGYFANMLIDSVNNDLIMPDDPPGLNTNNAFTFLGFYENKAFNQPSPMPNITEVLYSVDIKKDGPYADWDHDNEDGRIVTGIVWDDVDGKRYIVEINLHSLNRNTNGRGGTSWQTNQRSISQLNCDPEVQDCGTFAQYIILGGESWGFQYTPDWTWTNYSINWNSILQSLKSENILNAPLSTNSSIVEIGTGVEVRGEVQERLLVRNHRIYAQTYSISGTVTLNGSGLSGVTMTLSGASSSTTTTDASGNYSFSDLANGNYTTTPSLNGYTFTPTNRAVMISNANMTGQNFTVQAVAPSTYSISGTVTLGGNPLSGVTMTLSGAASGTTTTNASGNYSFSGLANGNYTVTPSSTGYTFTPVNRAVTISGANVAAQNFTATATSSTYSISGTVSTSGIGPSNPLSGVTMTLSGAAGGTTTTDASGNYLFTGLANGSYTVTPAKTGYTFTPVNRAVSVSGANVAAQNFTAQAVAPSTYSISGTVTLGGNPLSGVTMTLSGVASGTTTTDASGNYSFPGLANGNYTVTPSKTGYTFTPVNRAVTVSGANVAAQNFSATATSATYSISGTVSTSGIGPGSPLSGVTMTLSGAASGTTTTNASGSYSFAGLSNGSYTVTPAKTGYIFTPVNRAVTVSGANVTGQNFTAQ